MKKLTTHEKIGILLLLLIPISLGISIPLAEFDRDKKPYSDLFTPHAFGFLLKLSFAIFAALCPSSPSSAITFLKIAGCGYLLYATYVGISMLLKN